MFAFKVTNKAQAFLCLLCFAAYAAESSRGGSIAENDTCVATSTAADGKCSSSESNNNKNAMSSSAADPSGTFSCSLYLAQSTLPRAGLGLFTAKPIAKGATVGGEDRRFSDPFVEIADHYKTLPYRGQQWFLSWLGYVWPREVNAFYESWYDASKPEIDDDMFYGVDEGLNGAEGGFFTVLETVKSHAGEYSELHRREISAFAPGLSSLVNSVGDHNQDMANIAKNSASERDDVSADPTHGTGATGTRAGMPVNSHSDNNAYTLHHGVTYQAIDNIDAGSELLMDYGGYWWSRWGAKYLNEDGTIRTEPPQHASLEQQQEELTSMKLPDEAEKRIAWEEKRQKVQELHYLEEYDSGDNEADYDLYWEDDGGEDSRTDHDEADQGSGTSQSQSPRNYYSATSDHPRRDVEWLQQNGMCVDAIRAGESTIVGAGRGAFSNKHIAKGSVIAPAPLLALKREDMVIYSSDASQKYLKDVLNMEKVIGKELLTNYCWGHPNSELLLLPISPIVSYINHAEETPNAEIRWPDAGALGLNPDDWLKLHPIDVLDQSGKVFAVVVALKDISPGDEIRISYGSDWATAWEEYQSLGDDAPPFRHEVGVPKGFYPEKWLNTSVTYEVADIEKPLKPGEVVPLRWKHNGKIFLKGGFRIGLPTGFSRHIRQYAKERGIIRWYRQLLAELEVEANDFTVVKQIGFDEEWYASRYQTEISQFDIHYVSAWDEAAHKSFLTAFGRGGFGETVLKGIVEQNGYNNMTCFHPHFIGMSECNTSKIHADMYATDYAGLNILFPIYLVNRSKPELDIQADDANVVVGVNYRYDSAMALGDYGYHRTRAIRYDDEKAMRIIVGIYCVQVTEKNAKQMQVIYDDEDPAPFTDQFRDFPKNIELHWSGGISLLPK